LDTIFSGFQKIVSAHRREVSVSLSSAEKLEGKELEQVIKEMKTLVQPNAKIVLLAKYDKSLGSGYVINAPPKKLDKSFLGRQQHFVNRMTAAVDAEARQRLDLVKKMSE